MQNRKRINVLLLIWGLFSSAAAAGLENLHLELDSLAGSGWQVRQAALELAWQSDNELAFTLQAARLDLAGVKKPLRNLALSCPLAQYSEQTVTCQKGSLRIGGRLLDKPGAKVSFAYDNARQQLDLNVTRLSLAKGRLGMAWHSDADRWKFDLNANSLALDKLLTFLAGFAELPQAFHGFALSGTGSLDARVSGNASSLKVRVKGDFQKAGFSNAEGTQAGEDLDLVFDIDAGQKGKNWHVQGWLNLNGGGIYSAPVYVTAGDRPARLEANLDWQGKKRRLKLHELNFTHTGVASLQAKADLRFGDALQIKRLSLRLPRTSLARIHAHYLQTLLEDKGFERLKIGGELKADIEWRAKTKHVKANLFNVNIADVPKSGVSSGEPQGGYGMKGLNGEFNWQSGAIDSRATSLNWSGAHVSKIPLGKSLLAVDLTGDRIKLLTPLHVPILGGAVKVESFKLTEAGGEQQQMELRISLEPVEMERISNAFNIPKLGGRILGVIPSVRYANNRLEIAGALMLQLFDGNIVISELILTEPFGTSPELTAKIDVNNLDLHTLTRYFSFGDISGRLSGYVEDLKMLDWQPVAFNAFFSTPDNDKSPHVISQKAISNLSNIGGSKVTDVLSRSVLQIFEKFSYKRIGWGCLLENGICQMGGAEPAKYGYYIVKGGGLPRIDVLGYNKKVDWEELVKRVQSITRIGTPEIK
ncbi:MAG: hypothetical protein GY862_15445 [Gammaproteobacteria bacterium]|nr:hypothetical protein [Gammaproteobacteria bacterium]